MQNFSDISSRIRKDFISFFKKNDHNEISSSPLIPRNDPSLLFTNSGMVQFKNWFTGDEKPKHENVVTIQKCLRAGGKHNDLENVGLTPRHHTFFEMLGNFSFGGYFKEIAIELAWKLLIKEFQINKKKLIITVYNDDKESARIWKKVSNFSDSQIIRITSDDNFWSMGDSGPCGPCSEIFYDNGKNITGGMPGTEKQDGDRYVEIWNLVFMQYERKQKELKDLPIKCVDTGMGLERITALLSNKTNNYETDLFEYIFSEIEICLNKKIDKNNLTAFRIISDHIKSICMLMSEGVLPSNEGRGYVLRRIIRRTLLQVYKIQPRAVILNKLVKSVVSKYSEFYFELDKRISFIEKNLRNEEEKFSETLETGLVLLDKEIKNLNNKDFPAEIAFKLYDTYGFPVDLTQNILCEKKLDLDIDQYESIVKKNKSKQKETWTGASKINKEKIFFQLKDNEKQTVFLGYENNYSLSTLSKIIRDNKFEGNLGENKKDVILIFDKTPFYAESGGQVGDTGELFTSDGKFVGKINDTKKIDGDIFLHFISTNKLPLKVNEKYNLKIDNTRRKKIMNNHSATHLLHESLRKILGDHVSQKGSLVNDEKLRFDFTYNDQLKNDQIKKIEKMVNLSIRSNISINEEFMKVKDAIKGGAIALFGEKYPENARVISFVDKSKENSFSSIELCGGTHVKSTGHIGSFKIVSESSVSSGVRRIEAITGEEVNHLLASKIALLDEIKDMLRTSENNIIEKILHLKSEIDELRKESKKSQIDYSENKILSNPSYKIYFERFEVNPKELKNFSDLIKKDFKSGLIVLMSIQEKKVSIVISVTKDLSQKVNAVEKIKQVVQFLDGKGGGGRRDMAQGGAPVSEKVNELEHFLKESL
ncbi:MAG: alanine--tRNA ligase [Rickettsiales bacterium]|nr:alanine--tRNA ligase [Rickettsiales bacterium]